MKKIILALFAMIIIPACGYQQNLKQKEEFTVETTPLSRKFSSEQQYSINSNIVYDSFFPQHEPYGTGVGAMPGRVVWAYNTDSVEWDGKGWWWELEHFDETSIQNMVNESIMSLGGRNTTTESWNTLFTAHNISHGGK